MNSKKSKWMALAALLMFVGAVFQITSDHYILGVIYFAAAVSFSCSANVYRKKEKEETQKEVDDK
jgi:Zn-dependent membrane protease YugP